VLLRYSGSKTVNGRLVGSAHAGPPGSDADREEHWATFFIHLTGIGLADGEQCEFEFA
jgi:hypothetical protein